MQATVVDPQPPIVGITCTILVLAHAVILSDPFDGSGELVFCDRQRDEFLHPEVHRFHQQVRIEQLAHEKEADVGMLPRQMPDLLQRVPCVGIEIDDRNLRRRRGAQQVADAIDVPKLGDHVHTMVREESGKLFAVGGVRIDHNTIELNEHILLPLTNLQFVRRASCPPGSHVANSAARANRNPQLTALPSRS